MNEWVTVVIVAGSAAIASVMGGALALWRKPTTLFLSIALGFASGVLLATIAFEMLPQALGNAGLWFVVSGFVAGFAAVYAFDLFVHHGRLIGEHAEQRTRSSRRKARGSSVTVLAGGTSVEELIEGATGLGAVVDIRVALVVATAVAIDNFSEGLSVGELIRNDRAHGAKPVRRILGWTGLIGAAVFVSAVAALWLLRDIEKTTIGLLFAIAAGGMFYLVVTQLLPQAEADQFQQSAAIATAAGFLRNSDSRAARVRC